MVTLKGTKDGLLITLGAGEWDKVLTDLNSQLERPQASQFFNGAAARLAVGDRQLSGGQLADLGRLLEAHDMRLDFSPAESIRTPPRETRADIEQEPEDTPIAAGDGEKHEHEEWTEAVLIHRTIRSGQAIQHPGSIVILGDVNAGSEIVAGGDVIVWGRLRGLVHAGASGNEEARVLALQLAPTQLRIGSHIARAPDDRGKSNRGAEVARVREGRIVIESWKSG